MKKAKVLVPKNKFDSTLKKLLAAEPEPHTQIKTRGLAVLRPRYLRSELLVGQHFSESQILERPVKHGELFAATIEPIGKLIAVAAQVLYRNSVLSAGADQ